MKRALLAAPALVALLAVAALAAFAPLAALAAPCPPETFLVAARGAARVQLEQLGPDESRLATDLAHVPGRTLGYEVVGVMRVAGQVASALRDAFGRRDSYACTPETPMAFFDLDASLPIGIHFGTGAQAVTVVLHLPDAAVEIQAEGGARVLAPLSRLGQRRWELALAALARETGTSAEQFYAQMAPPVHSPPGETAAPDSTAPPDSTPPPRDGPRSPR